MGPPRGKPHKLAGLLPEVLKIQGSMENVNLLSYTVLAGTHVCSLGRQERPRRERELLERLCKMSSGSLQHVRERLDQVKEALLRSGYRVKLCRVQTESRAVVGTASAFGKVLFEVGLSFDPILNVPYIPASTLKGAFRHALEELAGPGEAVRVFGGEAKRGQQTIREAGLVGVTDAYPVSPDRRLLDPDVLTPHYSRGGEAVEMEIDVEPVPVVFAAIAPGVEFEFYIYYNKALWRLLGGRSLTSSGQLSRGADIHEGDLASALGAVSGSAAELLPLVDYAVIYALTRGIGAKTSVGYTRFKLLEYKAVS